MEADAFKAGVKPGGLLNSTQIKILICYILSNEQKAVPMRKLHEIMHFDGLANYFELSQAVTELKAQGNITEINDGGETRYTVTESGRAVASNLSDTLPKTVKDKALDSATKLLVRTERQKNNNVVISECEGGYSVTCTINEAGRVLLSVTLVVPKIAEAEQIKLNFLDDPSKVYSGIIELMANEKTHYDPKKAKPII